MPEMTSSARVRSATTSTSEDWVRLRVSLSAQWSWEGAGDPDEEHEQGVSSGRAGVHPPPQPGGPQPPRRGTSPRPTGTRTGAAWDTDAAIDQSHIGGNARSQR